MNSYYLLEKKHHIKKFNHFKIESKNLVIKIYLILNNYIITFEKSINSSKYK